jgi:hypothetical protein
MEKDLNVFIGSDTHCGHDVGLTPSDYNWIPPKAASNKEHKDYQFRIAGWKWFSEMVEKEGPFDMALWVGDLVDGSGEKTNGSEDQEIPTQVEMACDVVRTVNARQNYFVRGTPYHTGNSKMTWEDMVCGSVNGEIGDEGHYNLRGLSVNTKHKIGNSSSPVSRMTALSSVLIRQMLWSETGQQPKANLIIRGHIHRCNEISDPAMNKAAWTTPALMGLGSVFGARCVDGLPVHSGFLKLVVGSLTDWGVSAIIAPMSMQAAHVVYVD